MKLKVNVFAHSNVLMMNMLATRLTQAHVSGTAYLKHALMTHTIGTQNSASVHAILKHVTHVSIGIMIFANAFVMEFLLLKLQTLQETLNTFKNAHVELFGTSFAVNANLVKTKESARKDFSSILKHVNALATQHVVKRVKSSIPPFAPVFCLAQILASCLLLLIQLIAIATALWS